LFHRKENLLPLRQLFLPRDLSNLIKVSYVIVGCVDGVEPPAQRHPAGHGFRFASLRTVGKGPVMAARAAERLEDPGLSLALAMVVSSTLPLLLLDGDLKIVAASASFCRSYGVAPATVVGRQMVDLGDGEWDVPQLRSLVDATLSGDADIEAYEMDLNQPGQPTRRLVVNVQKLSYARPDVVWLLVSVADVTEARRSAEVNRELIQQNAVLMQEVRHRVANSLQIIASVLMQNARRSQSEETRNHLRDAHQRVLSVADLQQQLAASTLGTVRLRLYLTKLCETIAASMIRDPVELVLEVVAEDAVVDAGVSVSMGLIVTELVINALKHAFPKERSGRITVDYLSLATGWTLSVTDNGVGMPTLPPASGLGTSIVQALARQLRAEVEVTPAHPGTRVAVVHKVGAPAAEPLAAPT
jgi:two-component system, sensor histidine kinase PdtaS